MKTFIYLAFALLFFDTCTTEDSEKAWVYLELAIDNKDTTDEFIYGQIDRSTLKSIKNKGVINQLFSVENIRYISLEDSVEVEENADLVGTSTYFTKDVRKINEYKRDPLLVDLGYPLSQRSKIVRDEIVEKNKN